MNNNPYNSHSFQAASCRSQNMTREAELNEHFMRCDLADMIGGPLAKEYKSESRMYYEAKAAGQEKDAENHKRYMDLALFKMMQDR